MQAFDIADDEIMDLLTSGQPPQKPAVLETAEKGTHIAVRSYYGFCCMNWLMVVPEFVPEPVFLSVCQLKSFTYYSALLFAQLSFVCSCLCSFGLTVEAESSMTIHSPRWGQFL